MIDWIVTVQFFYTTNQTFVPLSARILSLQIFKLDDVNSAARRQGAQACNIEWSSMAASVKPNNCQDIVCSMAAVTQFLFFRFFTHYGNACSWLRPCFEAYTDGVSRCVVVWQLIYESSCKIRSGMSVYFSLLPRHWSFLDVCREMNHQK